MRKRILTGDRPTGKLHIGHLAGSLRNRVKMQESSDYEQFNIIANIQGLTDNANHPEKIHNSVFELILDYYAIGIDFEKTTVFLQSEVPEIHEIFIYLSNFATIQQISHNPTVKSEIRQKNFGKSTPLGFFFYPIHQVADILCVKGNLVPVGPGEVPQIEEAREIVRKFNTTYKTDILPLPQALVGVPQNVPGIDGNAKMGKSLGNCIYLSDSQEEIREKVFRMKTDPQRVHATDKGDVSRNIAFVYHDVFNPNKEEVINLKERYMKGTVSDKEVKEALFTVINAILSPIRQRREEAQERKSGLCTAIIEHSKRVRKIARETADEMKEVMMLSL